MGKKRTTQVAHREGKPLKVLRKKITLEEEGKSNVQTKSHSLGGNRRRVNGDGTNGQKQGRKNRSSLKIASARRPGNPCRDWRPPGGGGCVSNLDVGLVANRKKHSAVKSEDVVSSLRDSLQSLYANQAVLLLWESGRCHRRKHWRPQEAGHG